MEIEKKKERKKKINKRIFAYVACIYNNDVVMMMMVVDGDVRIGGSKHWKEQTSNYAQVEFGVVHKWSHHFE